MSDSPLALVPKVNSLATTDSRNLLAARGIVQRSPKIQRTFGEAAAHGWSSERLADRLALLLDEGGLQGTTEELFQTALYLADEYLQIGDSMLLVSPETGKAIARISDEDLWQPPDVPREGGGMARPLPRLHPKLEGFLVQWAFEKERSQVQTAALASRLNQTALLKEEGDRRLLVATRAGRKHIVDNLKDRLPEMMPDACQGSARRFLDRLNFVAEPSVGLTPLLQCVGYARTRTPVVDVRAMNLRHDPFTAIRAAIANQWAREVALSLAAAAHGALDVETFDIEAWPAEESYRKPGYGYWVAEPNTAMALVSEVFAVTGAPTICLRSKAGEIVIDPDSFKIEDRERADYWDVVASFRYTLHVDWNRIRAFVLTGVPVSGISVASRFDMGSTVEPHALLLNRRVCHW